MASLILHTAKNRLGAIPQELSGFPGDEVPEQGNVIHGRFRSGHVAKARQTPKGLGVKKIHLMPVQLIPEHQGRDRSGSRYGHHSNASSFHPSVH